MMRTLVFEPGYCPYEAFFKNAEDATAKVIRGESETLLPFDNDVIALVCSKAQQEQPPNRTLDEKTVIHGRFFVCGWDGKHIRELTRKQADRYYRRYIYPEKFETDSQGLRITPMDPKVKPADERLGKKGWFMER
jgi:hypothetical protein